MRKPETTEFSVATVAGETGVERDETCARVRFLPVAPASPQGSWSDAPCIT